MIASTTASRERERDSSASSTFWPVLMASFDRRGLLCQGGGA